MSALDMAQFMSDNPLNFISRGRSVDQSAVQIYNLPTCDECVNRFVVDKDNIDIVGIKICRPDQWFGNFLEKRFGFCIAQDRLRHKRVCRQSRGNDSGKRKADAAILG